MSTSEKAKGSTVEGRTPTIFKNQPVHAYASNLDDGVMGFNHATDKKVVQDRETWLASIGTTIDATTLVRITYNDSTDYLRIKTVGHADKGRGMRDGHNPVIADALFTREKLHPLFLPLADCAGIVLYDARQKVLGVVHLGRHATFAGLARKSIQYMQENFDTQPADVFVWLSPSISGESYFLRTFTLKDEPAWKPYSVAKNDGWYVDLQAYNIDQFTKAGVPSAQIEHAGVDTATHAAYPSHYRYRTHGDHHKAGRFAVVAWMNEAV